MSEAMSEAMSDATSDATSDALSDQMPNSKQTTGTAGRPRPATRVIEG